MPLGSELMPCTEESCEGGFFGISNHHFHCIFSCLLQTAAPFAGSVIKFEDQASIMASAIPSASVLGESTVAPEERGTGGRRRHTIWLQVAAAVIAPAMLSHTCRVSVLNDHAFATAYFTVLSQVCFFESFVIRKPLNLQYLIFRLEVISI
jgi:hypothetical protein